MSPQYITMVNVAHSLLVQLKKELILLDIDDWRVFRKIEQNEKAVKEIVVFIKEKYNYELSWNQLECAIGLLLTYK